VYVLASLGIGCMFKGLELEGVIMSAPCQQTWSGGNTRVSPSPIFAVVLASERLCFDDIKGISRW